MLVVKKIFISSDHAGVELRIFLKNYLESLGCTVADYGCEPGGEVDYPDYVYDVVRCVSNDEGLGVLICGTGIGMSIGANRNRNIRAALCSTEALARLAREHNDANVLCFGSRYIQPEVAKSILYTFLTTSFLGGRHSRRIQKLKDRVLCNDT